MFYVGLSGTTREVFKSPTRPTEEVYGERYAAVVGPFRTRNGAEFMRKHGQNNPHCRNVAEAERLAWTD